MGDLLLYAIYRKYGWTKKLYYYTSCQERKMIIPFDFDKYTDEFCITNFRFGKEEIHKLYKAFKIPYTFKCPNGSVFDGLQGFCILLRRLAYPNRLLDLIPIFHLQVRDLSYICNFMIKHIMDLFGHLLENINQNWLSVDNLQKYSRGIEKKGSPLKRCWGFIDGTVRPICRPKYHQRQCYNGHKRVHALKYQSIVAANGLIANLYGPIEGRRHDAFLLSKSNVNLGLQQMKTLTGEQLHLYGDPAYPLRPWLLCPFKGVVNNEQLEFNKRMSRCRVAVEWQFGKILQLWAFLDYKKNQKLFLQPLGAHFKISVLLTNCHTILYGSITSTFFEVQPPSLEEYLVPYCV